MNFCQMDSTIIQTHRYFDSEWFQCCLHRFGSSTKLKTTKNQKPNPPVEPVDQKCQLWTPPKGTFHSCFFNKILCTSYWGIDEWIWILTLVIWPIWKMVFFPLNPLIIWKWLMASIMPFCSWQQWLGRQSVQGNVDHLTWLLAMLPLMCWQLTPSLSRCTSNASLQSRWEMSCESPTVRGWFASWRQRRQGRWRGAIEPDTSLMTDKRMGCVQCHLWWWRWRPLQVNSWLHSENDIVCIYISKYSSRLGGLILKVLILPAWLPLKQM